jgi:hypothetical protein
VGAVQEISRANVCPEREDGKTIIIDCTACHTGVAP